MAYLSEMVVGSKTTQKLACLLLILPVLFLAGLAQAAKPGAFIWGDADGNGLIEIPDLSALANVLGNPGSEDATYYQLNPQSRQRQDLDGNGIIEVPDLSLLTNWVAGDFQNNPGKPETILLEGVTYYLAAGDSVMLSVTVLSNDAAGRAIRTGFGVIFRISNSSTCKNAQFYGYDADTGENIDLWRNEKAYHYTDANDGPGQGKANMKLKAGDCEDGQSIIIEVYIPDDVEANVTPGRFKAKLKSDRDITIIVDQTPPDSFLDSYPPEFTNSTGAGFSFSCVDAGFGNACSYECSLDFGDWSQCSSPLDYAGLGDGLHNFQVRAKDPAGNVDPSPASHDWTVDSTPPVTTITYGPPNPANVPDAVFEFSCAGGPCAFECRLDAGAWGPCASGIVYLSLAEGGHIFRARAIDAAGNLELTPAEYSWTVDSAAPDTLINSQPDNPSFVDSASFAFSCNESSCAFECSLDSGAWSSCASPVNYQGLSLTSHSFQVRASDAVGNMDSTPAAYAWIIETPPPDTIFTSYPPNPSNSSASLFEFICTAASCTYQCQMDSGGWESCSSPKSYAGNGSWVSTSAADAPSARRDHKAVWTGSEMVLWGGYDGSFLNSGARYDPSTDSWTATSLINAPSARQYHAAVWTGTEMIIWGGYNGSTLNTGGRYNPATDSWTATSTGANTPAARRYHDAVWTGTEMIIWGGLAGTYLNTGGRYHPASDSWTATSTTNAPAARSNHNSIWTNTVMIIWGGYSPVSGYMNSGARYNPAANSWAATSTANAPLGRTGHRTAWTGTEMITWGGYNGAYLNTGGRYNPAADSWLATSVGENSPSPRRYHSAVWTSTELIVWGGFSGSYLNSGARYNPSDDSWTPIAMDANLPGPRQDQVAVWTGNAMVVWGGFSAGPTYLNTGGVYAPQGLIEGSHAFEVRAYDQTGEPDPTPATYNWTIDLTRPLTAITLFPDNPSNSTNADFEFNCNENGCTYECDLDGQGWENCSSPLNYSALADGSHTFQVRATDAALNLELAPAEYTWDIDTIPPDTLIYAHPSSPTNFDSASFLYSCYEPDCTYECSLDSQAWEPCDSFISYSLLIEAGHVFQARSIDPAGNYDPTPASYQWTIDQTPPDTNITSGPGNPSDRNNADFVFSCSEPPCDFECQLDSGAWVVCSSPKHYAELANAGHTFSARAADLAGNVDLSPASYAWTVNAEPPDTIITSQPENPSSSTNAAFTFSCNALVCTFQCSLDGQAWSACVSPANYLALANGSHTYQVRALDPLGNVDLTPAGCAWTIDVTAPETTITNKPPNPTGATGAIFAFACAGGPCTFDCRLDGSAWAACVSPITYSSLADGAHSFDVRARDGAGNYDPTPAFYNWTIDTAPPDTFITASPPNPSNSKDATFEFNCSEASCTYECKLDDAGWESCNSPKRYFGDESWTATSSANATSARMNHRAVWTGAEMILWGGYSGSYLQTGGRYNPSTDSWTPTSTGANVPAGRRYHTAVWTGTEMIVWGGYNRSALNTGGRYDPSTDSWTATSTVNAPTGRRYLPALWIGDRMFIWGGRLITKAPLNTGGMYNPADDSWTATSTGANVPQARWNHTAVWTGEKVIIWGGVITGTGPYLNNGAVYSPGTDSWNPVSNTNAPPVRDKHAAVWTGTDMVIWGGDRGGFHNLNSGGVYNLNSDSWQPTSMTNVPEIRSWLSCTGWVWTGTEMIVWGGYNTGVYCSAGGRYDPAADSWLTTTGVNAPAGRYEMEIVWTGDQMVLWGGYHGAYLGDGSRYTPYGGILQEGSHAFMVRAYDQVGNVDPTPATYTWTVDPNAPGIDLLSGSGNFTIAPLTPDETVFAGGEVLPGDSTGY